MPEWWLMNLERTFRLAGQFSQIDKLMHGSLRDVVFRGKIGGGRNRERKEVGCSPLFICILVHSHVLVHVLSTGAQTKKYHLNL